MTNKLVNQLTELTSVDMASDKVPIQDASDTTELKYIVPNNLISDASATVKGKVELATDAETTTGTDTTRAITPANFTSQIGTRVQAYDADLTTWAGKTAPSGTVVGTSDTQTLTNKTLTNPAINYTDTTISVNVKCRAERTTAQNVPVTTVTKIQLSTESYDIGGDFDNATNYRFTAPVTGYYIITAKVDYASAGDQSIEQLDVRKNGSDFIRASDRSSGTGNGSVSIADIVSLSANDYIELFFSHGTGAGEDCTGSMAIHLLSI